jgi:hypothetical protein
MQDLDATLPEDHQARVIWDFLDRLDLSAFYASIQAVRGGLGRPASDPQVLLALWVYATVEGVGSARKLASASEFVSLLSIWSGWMGFRLLTFAATKGRSPSQLARNSLAPVTYTP